MSQIKADSQKSKKGYFLDEVEQIINLLPKRSGDILRRRFGLNGSKKQTLEKIGSDYGITRERIRQIIADAFKKIKKLEKVYFEKAEEKIIFAITSNSGIISQEEALAKLAKNSEKEQNAINFLIKCSQEAKAFEIKSLIVPCFVLNEFSSEKLKQVEKVTFDFLNGFKKTISHKKLVKAVQTRLGDEFQQEEIENWILTFDRIKINRFEKWGLKNWSEISPKNTKDKIYLVLKETGKPLHFTKIAQIIDEKKLSKKKAHPQTVHNELIKDKRFVLIGRGIYALSEWGYTEGTVKEVLTKIIDEKGPLSKEDIFPEILKIRKVKKATIMINLNNSSFFIKEKGLYKTK